MLNFGQCLAAATRQYCSGVDGRGVGLGGTWKNAVKSSMRQWSLILHLRS